MIDPGEMTHNANNNPLLNSARIENDNMYIKKPTPRPSDLRPSAVRFWAVLTPAGLFAQRRDALKKYRAGPQITSDNAHDERNTEIDFGVTVSLTADGPTAFCPNSHSLDWAVCVR